MFRIIRSEWLKYQWGLFFLFVIVDAGVNAGLGALSTRDYKEVFETGWDTFFMHSVTFHTLFFYPFYTGLFASMLCYYEYKDGGWKHLFTLPIPRIQIYSSKLVLLLTLMGFTQLFFLSAYLLSGYMLKLPGEIPVAMMLKHTLAGWLAVFPLASFQLWMAQKIRTFGLSIMFNILCVVPNLVLTGLHSSIGAWFPFTLPYYAMFPQHTSLSPRLDLLPFLFIAAFTFILYLFIGSRQFIRHEIH
ncbi:ABC transporter permease [Paenibacillus sp. FSL H7-0331]|uniref:ABC transporter permease n=1 Tax=Paenibacillus sp. FSL H7-0331 TaxID=1920421 RepID=UPI00096C2676|nr:ABC transporter permease [Paenibacillus sp. FSL H7-0331]OMF06107.1 hypothetical protein BK127_31430 [Paenibacillus sp. FSL H7-0331]